MKEFNELSVGSPAIKNYFHILHFFDHYEVASFELT